MSKLFLNVLKENKQNSFKSELILKEEIRESNKILKYLFNIIIFLGAFSFLMVGISSYIGFNIIAFLNASQIIFFPQGATMCFYGTLGIILSVNQFLILYWKVGEGYNEFNKNTGMMTLAILCYIKKSFKKLYKNLFIKKYYN